MELVGLGYSQEGGAAVAGGGREQTETRRDTSCDGAAWTAQGSTTAAAEEWRGIRYVLVLLPCLA